MLQGDQGCDKLRSLTLNACGVLRYPHDFCRKFTTRLLYEGGRVVATVTCGSGVGSNVVDKLTSNSKSGVVSRLYLILLSFLMDYGGSSLVYFVFKLNFSWTVLKYGEDAAAGKKNGSCHTLHVIAVRNLWPTHACGELYLTFSTHDVVLK